MEYIFDLPAEYVVESRGLTVTIDASALASDIVQRAVLHGLKQKIADAAAGAKKAAFREKREGETQEAYDKAFAAFDDKDAIALAGQALMQKVVDNLVQGDWGVERSSGSGLSAFDTLQAELYILGAKLDFPKGTKKPERIAQAWAALQECSAEVQDKVRLATERKIEQEKREAEELAALF